MELLLERSCFKIDKANAKAMIEGFYKEGKLFHQCIYCLARDKTFPRLITLDKSPTRFQLSNIGKSLDSDYFTFPYKYVAVLEGKYFIKYDSEIWEKICNNGLFDIWDPIAPYTRFAEAKSDPRHYRLVLLRIYEINEGFLADEINVGGARHHLINRDSLKVTTKKPVIEDTEFQRVKDLLEESIKDYQLLPQNTYHPIKPKVSTKEYSPPERPATLSERNFESILAERIYDLEEGLTVIKRQYSILPIGRIDLLCKDKDNNLVVIELKKFGAPNYSIIDQITRYMGYVKEKIANDNQQVRGIIVVGQKDEKLEYAAKVIPNLKVKTFRLMIE